MPRLARIALALLPVALFAFTAVVAFASHVDDFDYNLPVCATNDSGSTLNNAPMVATINADQLADGFTQNDFLDLLAVNPNQEHAALLAQDTGSTDARWWVEMDTINDGQTRCWEIHLGNATAVRDQPVFLRGSSESVDVPDAASLDITTALTLEALGVEFRELPGDGAYMTGGEVTQVDGFRVHRFDSSGTLTVDQSGTVNYLIVAGGAGGGGSSPNCACGGGGGGAGGADEGTVTINGTQTITVGTGGSGNNDTQKGDNGTDSSIGALVSVIGGGGGGAGTTNIAGKDGGSGGGGGSDGSGAGGSGTAGQGNDGAAGDGGSELGGGGGGHAAAGSGATGGSGTTFSVPSGDVTAAAGGDGGSSPTNPGDAGSNPGDGGDGAFTSSTSGLTLSGGDGADGVVFVWYEVGCLSCKADYGLSVGNSIASGDITIGGSSTTVSSNTISIDVEYDLAATYDGSALKLWVDDTLADSAAASGSIDTNAEDLFVGNFTGHAGRTIVHDASGTQADSTANGNDGTPSNGPVGRAGPNASIRGGLDFDGDDDLVTVSAAAAINNIFDGGGTTEVWFHPRSGGEGSSGRIIDKRVSASGWRLHVANEASGLVRLVFSVGFSSNAGQWQTAVDIPIDEWTSGAVIYDADSDANDPTVIINGTDVRTVGDGLTETSTPSGTRNDDSTRDLFFGNASGGSSTFDGTIADVRLWDDTRTTSEINTNYQTILTGSEAGLAGYWKLDNRVLDLDYEPGEVSQTQEGAAGNSWTWTGSITDQSGSNNGTYTFVRPYMASVTADVQALISKAALPTVLVTDDIKDIVGDLPGVEGTETAENFPGRDAIQEAIDFAGGPDGAAWFGFAVLIGIGLGAWAAWGTGMPLFGFIALGAVVGAGSATGTYNIWLGVGVALACFGVGGAMAFADAGRR